MRDFTASQQDPFLREDGVVDSKSEDLAETLSPQPEIPNNGFVSNGRDFAEVEIISKNHMDVDVMTPMHGLRS